MQGWVKVHRKFLKWEWYGKPEMVALFLHLLLHANHKDRLWRNLHVLRGQLVVGRKELAEKTGISEQTIRTCLKRLKSTNEITIKATSHYSVITLVNWELYQGEDEETTSQPTSTLTNHQPATNQQLTTPKELKKERIDDDVRASDHPKEMVSKIYDWLTDYFNSPIPYQVAPIIAWLKWGADFELDIKPAAEAQKARETPRSLAWLDRRIASSIKQRSKPMPNVNGKAAGVTAADDEAFFKQYGITDEMRQKNEPSKH